MSQQGGLNSKREVTESQSKEQMLSASPGSAKNLIVHYVCTSAMISYPHFCKKHVVPALKLNYSFSYLH